MVLARFLIRFCRRYKAGLLRRLYRCHALWAVQAAGGTLSWPATAAAAAPVRVFGPGHVVIGDRVCFGYVGAPRMGSGEIFLRTDREDARIDIGARTATSNNVSIISMKLVQIGEACRIGDMVSIYDCDFHEISPATRNASPGEIRPVVIGRNVWLGSRVMVLKGVTIGDNTVVAAGAVVTKSLPANVVAGGVPAKVIREIGPAQT